MLLFRDWLCAVLQRYAPLKSGKDLVPSTQYRLGQIDLSSLLYACYHSNLVLLRKVQLALVHCPSLSLRLSGRHLDLLELCRHDLLLHPCLEGLGESTILNITAGWHA